MKRNLFLMGVSVLLLTSCAKQLPFLRSVTGNVNVYKTRTDLKVKKAYNPKTGLPEEDDKTEYILSPRGGHFLRYSLLNDTIKDIIRILPVVEYQGNKIVFDNEGNNTDHISDYYFQYAEKDIKPYQKYLASEKLTALPVTIPFKYRFADSKTLDNITANVSLTYAMGYRIRVNNNPYKANFIRLLLGTGISNDKYVPKGSDRDESYEPSDHISWTVTAFGVTYEAGSRFNFGAFVGFDKMFGTRKDWVFQNKPWIGLGFGYKL
mgnify:FL=1